MRLNCWTKKLIHIYLLFSFNIFLCKYFPTGAQIFTHPLAARLLVCSPLSGDASTQKCQPSGEEKKGGLINTAAIATATLLRKAL